MYQATSEPGEQAKIEGRSSPALFDRLEQANRLYREFYIQCFWHCPRDLIITEELLPFVVKGLKTYGGRRGFLLAAQLREDR